MGLEKGSEAKDGTGQKKKRCSDRAPPHSSWLEAAEDECQTFRAHSLSSPRQGLCKSWAPECQGWLLHSQHVVFPARASLLHLLLCSRASASSPAMIF